MASEQDLVRDHDLIRRMHTQGILNPDKRANDEWEASIFTFEGPPAGDRNCRRSPYVLVGGKLDTQGSGAKFSLSWDGKSWQDAGQDLDKFFPPAGPARYEYRLRCELKFEVGEDGCIYEGIPEVRRHLTRDFRNPVATGWQSPVRVRPATRSSSANWLASHERTAHSMQG